MLTYFQIFFILGPISSLLIGCSSMQLMSGASAPVGARPLV